MAQLGLSVLGLSDWILLICDVIRRRRLLYGEKKDMIGEAHKEFMRPCSAHRHGNKLITFVRQDIEKNSY